MRLRDKASVAHAASQGNWRHLIRPLLFERPKRFKQLLDSLEGVSSKALS